MGGGEEVRKQQREEEVTLGMRGWLGRRNLC